MASIMLIVVEVQLNLELSDEEPSLMEKAEKQIDSLISQLEK